MASRASSELTENCGNDANKNSGKRTQDPPTSYSSRKERKTMMMPVVESSAAPLMPVTVTKLDNKEEFVLGTWISLPSTVRVHILNFFGEAQEELRNLKALSRQLKEDCENRGIEWEITPTLELSPSLKKKKKHGYTGCFFQNLRRYQSDNDANAKLRRCRHLRVKDIDKFGGLSGRGYDTYSRTTRNIQILDGIISLDISCPSKTTGFKDDDILRCLSLVLPNLLQVDFSNTDFFSHSLRCFTANCPHLEKISWNNMDGKYFYVNGIDMENASKNLKEIIMDDSCFLMPMYEINDMLDLENSSDCFIFSECCEVVERVSIRNAKIRRPKSDYASSQKIRDYIIECISQNALIKFVRNAPQTLKWFRSDLSKENMDMLRLERPEIELLN